VPVAYGRPPCENFIGITRTLIARIKSVFPELLALTVTAPFKELGWWTYYYTRERRVVAKPAL
jgi:hypothetical protein